MLIVYIVTLNDWVGVWDILLRQYIKSAHCIYSHSHFIYSHSHCIYSHSIWLSRGIGYSITTVYKSAHCIYSHSHCIYSHSHCIYSAHCIYSHSIWLSRGVGYSITTVYKNCAHCIYSHSHCVYIVLIVYIVTLYDWVAVWNILLRQYIKRKISWSFKQCSFLKNNYMIGTGNNV